jgi:hypothetical protein
MVKLVPLVSRWDRLRLRSLANDVDTSALASAIEAKNWPVVLMSSGGRLPGVHP